MAHVTESSIVFKRIDNLVTAAELQELAAALATAHFEDGMTTAGRAVRDVKHNLQATGQEPETERARRIVNDALTRNVEFREATLPFRILPPMFSRYEAGMRYGEHTDNPIMGRDQAVRTDLALTLFLADPGSYDGGELVVDVDREPRRFKLAAGGAIVYPATSLHRVEPVTRGTRFAAVTWVQSVVRDSAQRELIADLGAVLAHLRAKAPNTRANLLRMWADL
jgi:PKHD-type hydroxylase